MDCKAIQNCLMPPRTVRDTLVNLSLTLFGKLPLLLALNLLSNQQTLRHGLEHMPSSINNRISAPTWHADNDTTPMPGDVLVMVEILEAQHGVLAADVADFFSTSHSLRGDAGRSWAWAGVAEMVRQRVLSRLTQH
jgi:hypothetical protein